MNSDGYDRSEEEVKRILAEEKERIKTSWEKEQLASDLDEDNSTQKDGGLKFRMKLDNTTINLAAAVIQQCINDENRYDKEALIKALNNMDDNKGESFQ